LRSRFHRSMLNWTGIAEHGIGIYPCQTPVSRENGFHVGAAIFHMPARVGLAPLGSHALGDSHQVAVVRKAQGDAALAIMVHRFQCHCFPVVGFFTGHDALKIADCYYSTLHLPDEKWSITRPAFPPTASAAPSARRPR